MIQLGRLDSVRIRGRLGAQRVRSVDWLASLGLYYRAMITMIDISGYIIRQAAYIKPNRYMMYVYHGGVSVVDRHSILLLERALKT
jgi:hypothetical protein